MFTQNKEDKKRLENVLKNTLALPLSKNDTISPEKFGLEDFFNFYKDLTQRTEVKKVFQEMYEIILVFF